MYGTIYNVSKKLNAKDKPELSFSACFADHYAEIQKYKVLDIYVLKKYLKQYHVSQANMVFNKEQVEEYSNLLLKAGFKFELSETIIDVYNEDDDRDHKEIDAWKFHILVQKNSNISNLILINAIRYLYECPYENIVRHFLLLCNCENSDLIFNNLCIAHAAKIYSSGHSLNNMGGYLMGLYTQEEFEKEILQQKEIVYNSGGIRKLNKLPVLPEREALRNTFLLEDGNLIIKKFKEVYDKHR